MPPAADFEMSSLGAGRKHGHRRSREEYEESNNMRTSETSHVSPPGLPWLKLAPNASGGGIRRVDAAGADWQPSQVGFSNSTHGTAFTAGLDGNNSNNDFLSGISSFLGKPIGPITQNPYDQFSRETHDLPEAFGGPRPETTMLIIERMNRADLWPIQTLLPFSVLDDPNGGIVSQEIFDTHMMSRTTYEVAARNVTNRSKSQSYSTQLFTLGQTLERGFWLEPKGQRHWAMGLIQMTRAALETLCMMALLAVLSMVPAATIPEEEFDKSLTVQTFNAMVRKSIDAWGALQLKQHGLAHLSQWAGDLFNARRQLTGPRRLILPTGSKRVIGMAPERRVFLENGRPVNLNDPFGTQNSLSVAGMTDVFETRPLVISSTSAPVDPFWRHVAIGEKAYVKWDIPTAFIYDDADGDCVRGRCRYRTEHAEFVRFFDRANMMQRVSAKEWFWNDLMYINRDRLSIAGAFEFSDLKSPLRRDTVLETDEKKQARAAKEDRASLKNRYDEWEARLTRFNNDAGGLLMPYTTDNRSKLATEPQDNGPRRRDDDRRAEYAGNGQFVYQASIHTVGSYYLSWSSNGKELLDYLSKAIASQSNDTVKSITALVAGAVGPNDPAELTAALAAVRAVTNATSIASLQPHIKVILKNIELKNASYWTWAMDHNIPLFRANLTAIPEMVYDAGSAVAFMDGLGFTKAGFADYCVGFRPLTRIYDANFRFLACAVVVNALRGAILPNILIRDYVRGNEREYYTPDDRVAWDRGQHRKSMFSFACPPGVNPSGPSGMPYLDVSGRFSRDNVLEPVDPADVYSKFHFHNAPIYSRIWKFAAVDRRTDVNFRSTALDRNTLCIQGNQIMCDEKGEYTVVVPGQGHWGQYAEDGDRNIRTGAITIGDKQPAIYKNNSRYRVVPAC